MSFPISVSLWIWVNAKPNVLFFFVFVSIPIVTALLLKIFSPKISSVFSTFAVAILPLVHTAKFSNHLPEWLSVLLLKLFIIPLASLLFVIIPNLIFWCDIFWSRIGIWFGRIPFSACYSEFYFWFFFILWSYSFHIKY